MGGLTIRHTPFTFGKPPDFTGRTQHDETCECSEKCQTAKEHADPIEGSVKAWLCLLADLPSPCRKAA